MGRTVPIQAGKHFVSAGIVLLFCCPWFLFGVDAQTSEATARQAREILKTGIESKEPNTRIQAVIAISMIGNNEVVVNRLITALQDEDVQVRISAVRALTDLKSPQVGSALQKTLEKDEVPEVAFAVAKALYKLHDPAGSKTLMDVYDGKVNPNSNYLKKESRNVFRNFHSVQSGAMFVVGQGIGFVPVPGVGEGFAAMTELLSDPELSARASVVLLMGNEKSTSALDLLRKALSDNDWSVRAAGAQMVAQTSRMELSDSLVPLFSDKKEKVRFRAAGAYLHLAVQQHNTTALRTDTR